MKKFVTTNKSGINKNVDVNVKKRKSVMINLFFNPINSSVK